MRNPEEKAAVFGMYLKGQHTLPQIAAAKNVPYGTVKSWHERDHWSAKRRELLIHANETAEERFARERELILDGELTIGRMAREIVSGELRKILKANNPEPMKVSDTARLAALAEKSNLDGKGQVWVRRSPVLVHRRERIQDDLWDGQNVKHSFGRSKKSVSRGSSAMSPVIGRIWASQLRLMRSPSSTNT